MQFLLRFISVAARLQDGNLARALIFMAISHANVESLGRDRKLAWLNYAHAPPDALRRPIRVHALAQSLTFSPETTRRHVQAMIARGECSRVAEGGVIATHTYVTSPAFTEAMNEMVQSFDRLIQDFHAIGADLSGIAKEVETPQIPGDDDARVRANLIFHGICKFSIKVIVDSIPMHGDYLTAVVYTAIFSANTRHIAIDPTLTWRYAETDDVAPDDIRHPVTVRQLASELGMPYATIHRQVARMMAAGACVRANGGVILPRDNIRSPAMSQAGQGLRLWFFSMVRELRAEGVDFARGPSPYGRA